MRKLPGFFLNFEIVSRETYAPAFIKQSQLEYGFTMLETLVALTIFAIVSVLMAPVFVSHMQHNLHAEQKTGAIEAAQIVLDELRLVNPTTLPSSGSSGPQTIVAGERSYQVLTRYCSPSTYCTSRSRQIKLEVSFKNKLLYNVETVFTQLK